MKLFARFIRLNGRGSVGLKGKLAGLDCCLHPTAGAMRAADRAIDELILGIEISNTGIYWQWLVGCGVTGQNVLACHKENAQVELTMLSHP